MTSRKPLSTCARAEPLRVPTGTVDVDDTFQKRVVDAADTAGINPKHNQSSMPSLPYADLTEQQQTAFSFASPLGQTFATGCIGFESCGIDPHAWALDFIVTIVSLESIYITWRYPAEDENGNPHPRREALRKRTDWTVCPQRPRARARHPPTSAQPN